MWQKKPNKSERKVPHNTVRENPETFENFFELHKYFFKLYNSVLVAPTYSLWMFDILVQISKNFDNIACKCVKDFQKLIETLVG